jgi:hypothetical protein
MRVRRIVSIFALSSMSVIGGVAMPASAAPTISTTLHCVGKYPVDATYQLTPWQVRVLKATVSFIDTHPLFGTQCTVTP